MQTARSVESRYGGAPVSVVRMAQNGGPARARNAGFAAATGDWIAVLDADDAFEAGRLRHLTEAGSSTSADVVADNIRLYDFKRQFVSPPQLTTITRPFVMDLPTFVAGARPGNADLDFGLLKPVFRTSFLRSKAIGYPADVRHGEDFLFYFDLIASGAKFLIVPETSYLWTLRSSGQSQTRLDYLQQVSDTDKVKKRAGIADDRTLVNLLDQRCRALIRLHQTRAFSEAMAMKRRFAALRLLVRHPFLLNQLGKSVRRRLGA